MKSTTIIFLMAFGWAVTVLPPEGFATPDDKPRVLIAKLGRGGMNQLWLDASVENVKGAMIVDTGAEDTVLSHDKFGFLLRGPEHKLPSGTAATTHVNSMTAKVALARDFHVGGNDLGGTLVSLVGNQYLSDGEAFRYANRRGDFDGLLGENFLRRYHAVIDCHRQLLYLTLNPVRKDHVADFLIARGWTRVPMADAGRDFTVPCTLDGNRFRLLVDTGSAFTTVDKTLAYAARLPTHDLPIVTGIIGNDTTPMGFARVKALRIGDYTASDVRLATAERLQRDLISSHDRDGLPIIGFLGGDTLGFNGAIIDVGEHALYLKHL